MLKLIYLLSNLAIVDSIKRRLCSVQAALHLVFLIWCRFTAGAFEKSFEQNSHRSGFAVLMG